MRWLYVVRDVKAEDVGEQVMVCKSDAVAVRAFTDALLNPNNFMAKYPEDYELLEIGSLGDDGRIEAPESPRTVLSGAQWKLSQTSVSEASV